MKPYKQGDKDGMCGFYAIGNAIKLLYPKYDTDEIFKTIYKNYFEQIGGGTHLIDGTNRVQLANILNGTLKAMNLNITVKTPFWNHTASNLSEFRTTVVEHLSEEKTAAIVGYCYFKDESNEDDDEHYTVLERATDKSVYTCDSSNAKRRIGFSEMRITSEITPHKSRPYLFRSTELFLLRREQ